MTIKLNRLSGFTYQDVITDALIDLNDQAQATYTEESGIMKKLVNDSARILRKVLARKNPEMIQSTFVLNLEAGNAGPYSMVDAEQNPINIENPIKLLDENEKEVGTSYRGEYNVSTRTRKPDGHWLEGWNPVKIFLSAKPDKAYVWTLYYIPSLARQSDMTVQVPFPDMFREPLVQWVVKFAANSKEYATSNEDVMIQFMENLLGDILQTRRQKYKLVVKGVAF